MTFPNILRNSNLTGSSGVVASYMPQGWPAPITVENPTDWEMVSYPKDPDDPQFFPGSQRRANGYGISVGYYNWEGGFLQRDVPLRGGQRYLAKAWFTLDSVEIANVSQDANWKQAVEWQFVIHVNGVPHRSQWMSTGRNHWTEKKMEEALWVFQPTHDSGAAFQLLMRSYWGTVQGLIEVNLIACEEVPADYGSPQVLEVSEGAVG